MVMYLNLYIYQRVKWFCCWKERICLRTEVGRWTKKITTEWGYRDVLPLPPQMAKDPLQDWTKQKTGQVRAIPISEQLIDSRGGRYHNPCPPITLLRVSPVTYDSEVVSDTAEVIYAICILIFDLIFFVALTLTLYLTFFLAFYLASFLAYILTFHPGILCGMRSVF